MSAVLSLLAYDREDLMVAALAALMVAGIVVAVGAWLLFFREARRPLETGAPDDRAQIPEPATGEPDR